MPSRTCIAALLLLGLLGLDAPATAGAVGPIASGVAEHTVTRHVITRNGAFERDERVETWVSARRAKVIYTQAATGEVLGACTGTRTVVRCFDRDPALEGLGAENGRLFVPSWAETGRVVRRGVSRGWLRETGRTRHRGIPARRLRSTPAATGDPGQSTILAARGTWMPLLRQSTSTHRGDTVTSTEDVLSRRRVPVTAVDFGLGAPPGEAVVTRHLRDAETSR